MRGFTILWVLATAAIASAEPQIASIYIQPVSIAGLAPSPLADIKYDVTDVSSAEVVSYDAPELPEGAALVRIGVFDSATKQWVASTSVASVENFGKGYSPALLLTIDGRGDVLGAAVKGVRIDAGQTRDFGPQAVVQVTKAGKQPELNKPVVLSPEGKKVVPEEKTFLQKYTILEPMMLNMSLTTHRYWWLIGIVVMLAMSGGGDGK
ncbi:putative nuc-1 negative regulatory protein preg protein [Phaeoacremonium minimum UCRPA7]|uniref:Putative nuc-1 negative regulatory protein preg protein n=1 Tax=Phaeoacremonium minimum (strain UCR-PA7) TaxID=1286976 RepID=R8BL50_PHAM7|nr:putative nuc-1 negative regulatory protein preg protein [Phaeoacremonium minimum UCRPA7]EOO00093.1 putative nuc-1 negative regulatory protein preg protein [Phaeoacremonium minimum UCRPA7]